MQFSIKIKQPLRAENTAIDPGATIILNKASRPVINLLRYYFLTQPEALAGSRAALTFLMSFSEHPEDLNWKVLDAFISHYATPSKSSKTVSITSSSQQE